MVKQKRASARFLLAEAVEILFEIATIEAQHGGFFFLKHQYLLALAEQEVDAGKVSFQLQDVAVAEWLCEFVSIMFESQCLGQESITFHGKAEAVGVCGIAPDTET